MILMERILLTPPLNQGPAFWASGDLDTLLGDFLFFGRGVLPRRHVLSDFGILLCLRDIRELAHRLLGRRHFGS